MKIKAFISLALSLIICLSLISCKKSELILDGDDTYIYNTSSLASDSDDTKDDNVFNMFEYTNSEFIKNDTLDWEKSENIDTFIYIKNLSGIKIKNIAYRPREYNTFKTLAINEIEANLFFLKIPNEDLLNYEFFDFIIVTENDIVTIFNEISLLNKRGLQITCENNEFKFEYLK